MQELQDTQHEEEAPREIGQFIFRGGYGEKKEGSVLVMGEGKKKEITFRHNRIQNRLCELLIQRYGSGNVGSEVDTGFKKQIDVVVQDGDDLVFYEVKTESAILQCVRSAVSQLIEYSYFPNESRARRLVIVSPHEPTNPDVPRPIYPGGDHVVPSKPPNLPDSPPQYDPDEPWPT